MVKLCLGGWVVLWVDVIAMPAVCSQKMGRSGNLDSFGLLLQSLERKLVLALVVGKPETVLGMLWLEPCENVQGRLVGVGA